MDPIFEAYIISNNELLQFYLDVAKYVDSNTPIDLDRYKPLLETSSKEFDELYRVWGGNSYDNFIEGKFNVGKNKVLATTKLIKMIEQFASSYEKKAIITIHKGKGIYVNSILEEAMNNNIVPKNALKYIKQVYKDNSYQEEVLIKNTRQKIMKKDIIGIWDPDVKAIIEPDFDVVHLKNDK